MRSIVAGLLQVQEESNRGGLRRLSLIDRRCSAPLSLNHLRGDGEASDSGKNGDGLSVRNFWYHKLPKNKLIKLSVLKLDGSLFEVHVAKKATLADLKQAIEEVFSTSPKEGQGKISWTHVWGHFCLCYEGQRLLSDKAHIQSFGIKDGDQLQFIRHMSINHSPVGKQTKSESVASKQYWRSRPGSHAHGEKEQAVPTDDVCEDQEEAPMPEFKLAHFLKGWLSYSRLWGLSRKGSGNKSRPSRFSLQCLGGTPKIYSCKGSN